LDASPAWPALGRDGVPIWLTLDAIAALEKRHGIKLFAPGTTPTSITGHIDFLQVRNGAIHILDYKPDARTNRPLAQLTTPPAFPCVQVKPP
jgi:hypothetical protein